MFIKANAGCRVRCPWSFGLLLAAAVIVAILTDRPSAGADLCDEQQLTAIEPTGGDFFGCAVAMSGDTAIVGAYGEDVTPDDESGAAYVFQRVGETWTRQARLVAADAWFGAGFGTSVALDGELAVVGAPADPGGGHAYSGAAYVFERVGGVWVQRAKLVADDADSDELLGSSVAIFGETIVLAQSGQPGGTERGAAYVFEREGEAWVQRAKLVAADVEPEDYFGCAVAIWGDLIAVGAFLDEYQGTGSVYLFERQPDASWDEVAKFGALGEHFGISVAALGNVILAGAPGYDNGAGAAYLFDRDGDAWVQVAGLTALDGQPGDGFGGSVSMTGTVILVGAPGRSSRAGAVYVFELDGCTWVQGMELVPAATDLLGCSVGVSGRWAIGGAEIAGNHGAAYVYDLYACLCPADVDDSDAVDFGDLLEILSYWGTAEMSADLDVDGTVGFGDLLIVLSNWGPCP